MINRTMDASLKFSYSLSDEGGESDVGYYDKRNKCSICRVFRRY